IKLHKMGILSGLFGAKKEQKEQKIVPWTDLTSVEQLTAIEEAAESTVVAIFKHSTRCGTSRMAFNGFERGFDPAWENVNLYVVDVLNNRALSDEISRRFQVLHQSPQLLVIKSGKVVGHYSHYQVSAGALAQF